MKTQLLSVSLLATLAQVQAFWGTGHLLGKYLWTPFPLILSCHLVPSPRHTQ